MNELSGFTIEVISKADAQTAGHSCLEQDPNYGSATSLGMISATALALISLMLQ